MRGKKEITMGMLCNLWLTDFPMIQMLIADFYRLHPEVPRIEHGEMLQWLSFVELEDCDSYKYLTSDTVILVGGGTLHKPIDIGNAILISDSGMISAPVYCGYFHTRRTIVCVPVFQRGRTVEGINLIGKG